MAELKTRIQLKYDTLANWEASSLVLKKGEVAFAEYDVVQHDGQTKPVVTIKVGDNVHTWSGLTSLVYANAADVYSWAKQPTLTYANLPEELKTEIDNLQAALGEGGNVSTQIANAIAALDNTDTEVAHQFVYKVDTVDGKAVPARKALVKEDIPTIEQSQVNGLESKFTTVDTAVAANKKAVEDEKARAEAAEKVNADAIAKLNDGEDVEGSVDYKVAQAIAEVNSEAEALEGRVATLEGEMDAVEGKLTTNEAAINQNKADIATNKADIATEKARAEAAEKVNADAIAAVKEDVDAFLSAAEVGEAAIDTLKEIQDYIAADGTAAATLTGKVDANTTAIATNKAAIEAINNADNGILAQAKAYTDEAKTALQGEIDADVKVVADNLANEVERAEGAEAALRTDLTAAQGNITTNANAIATEKERAEAKEKHIEDLITAEVARAKGEEARIEGLITTEVARAEAAEEALGGRIDGVVTDLAALSSAAVKGITTTANNGLVVGEKTAEGIVSIEIDYNHEFILACGSAN